MPTAALLLAAGVTLLAGCGQKGALYLPPKPGAVVTSPPPATSAPSQPPQESPAQPPQSAPPGAPETSPTPPPKKTTQDEDTSPPK
jgi:predicted small lipoprotein YifL